MKSVHPDLAGGRLTIDLGALVDNWRNLDNLAGSAECSAVVKANTYGCGIAPVTAALANAGCKTFFVALPEEGIQVKDTAPDARCFVLNGLFADAAPHYLKHNLIPILGSVPEVVAWAAFANQQGAPLPCALHMDSGMTRLGMSPAELAHVTKTPSLTDHIDIRLFMTHYACADDIGHPQTIAQRNAFMEVATSFPGVPCSAANSAAILQNDGHAFDLVRPGIALYGGEALNDVPNPMKPVATLEARIIQIRSANTGDAVGYGAAEVLQRDTRIAYVATGYADGYHRAASNQGVPMRDVASPAKAAFKGTIINGIGRISMDMCGFDVTDVPENGIAAGDWIELFGDTIALDDVARAAGTIGYEMLTGLGARYQRSYVGLPDAD